MASISVGTIAALASTAASAAGPLLAGNQISQGANSANDWVKQVYGNEQGQLAPYISTGQGALYSLASLLGVPGASAPGAPGAAAPAGTAAPAISTNTVGAPITLGSGRVGGSGTGVGAPGSALAPVMATQPSAAPTAGASGYGSPAGAFAAFQQTPYYQFPLQQGLTSLGASNAAKGLYNSGATAKDILQYATGYASQGLGGYMSALSSLAGGGSNAAANLAATGVGTAGTISNNTLTGAGATAAGTSGALQNLFGSQGATSGLYGSNAFNSTSYGDTGGALKSVTAPSTYTGGDWVNA